MHLFEARAKKRKTQWDLRKATGIHQSAYSGRFRPAIPEEAGHPFRLIPATPYHKIS